MEHIEADKLSIPKKLEPIAERIGKYKTLKEYYDVIIDIPIYKTSKGYVYTKGTGTLIETLENSPYFKTYKEAKEALPQWFFENRFTYRDEFKEAGFKSFESFWKAVQKRGNPLKKEPWEMTREEIKNWDFEVPEGGASKTPKTVFSWKKEDYETLYDLSQYKDKFRYNEVLGKGWEHEWKPSFYLKEKIEKNQPITIYRASEYRDIIPGAYVSELLEYVKKHQEIIMKGRGKIFSKQVRPSELMIYGDPHEFIYIPESVESYHKQVIQQALKEGKPVPLEALADYPDLQREHIGV